MDKINQIKDICNNSYNKWFLTHISTKLAFIDILLIEKYGEDTFNERKCTCFADDVCIFCNIEMERTQCMQFNPQDVYTDIFDYNKECYKKTKFITYREKNKIIGFMLLIEGGMSDIGENTYGLNFAYVIKSYRGNGVLKKMIGQIPEEWNIWLETNSTEIENISYVWEKCGFKFHKIINNKHIIYKKINKLN
jgi:predicted acetyltransferase